MNDKSKMIKRYSKRIIPMTIVIITVLAFINIGFAASKNNDIASIIDRMIQKSIAMGYSIYVVLATVLLLVITMILTWRNRVLSTIVMILSGSICGFMIYYLASDIKIPIFGQVDNLLFGIKSLFLNLGGSALLIIVVVGFVLSIFSKKVRKRGRRSSAYDDDGYDYDDYYDDDNDDNDGDDD